MATFAAAAAGGSSAAGAAGSRGTGSRSPAGTAGSDSGLGRGRPGFGRRSAPLLEHLCDELECGGLLLASTGPPTGVPAAALGALEERAQRRERGLLSALLPALLPLLHVCGRYWQERPRGKCGVRSRRVIKKQVDYAADIGALPQDE